ncbi:DEAD/DEAH box helicase family protein [Pseudorhodoferax sp. Leaf267]|uniref:nSTAND3 domain-containing NTPase n=1 Tax=Pseudorhodoferax sp. Leaf267 TaxID=1736316 RepID=UPI0006F38DA5|nr:DEAD/DEAH box helicase family protein [Pseudorhodoferax sp. Leaf267]KQP23351.1 hypothetical protein ASF43_05680 [Pseudorhodoferax sp. Leaf267]
MYELHRLGWNSFQQLCLSIAREVLGQTVQSFLDANDAGRDGAFAGHWSPKPGQDYKGTFVIQCKFSKVAGRRLTVADVAEEIPKVRALAAQGLCDVYILMTNAGVTGRQDARIQAEFVQAGAKNALVFGVTWIEDQILGSARLRMLVPRVYGLGDLSQILDERAYRQAHAVLESMKDELAKVVLTDAYRKAVRALDAHSFVLLIGEPAAGKTTIASMLAMASADRWKSLVVKVDDPSTIVERWNVDEPSQFFWVDDAFGSMQYESLLVYEWNRKLTQVNAMLRRGAKIVMTSRDYIYNRARQDLKDSMFPLVSESHVVIDVHELSSAEREQILYNHLKLGAQPQEFVEKIVPHLDAVAAHPRFVPEIARRLANPKFTEKLYLSRYSLEQFVEKREQLLLDVIEGLDDHSKAALGLIYMRRGNLESPIMLRESEPQALERMGSTLGECLKAMEALNDSLVIHTCIDDQTVWRFKHPTIGDAYATSLAKSSEMLVIYIRGSATESLLSQVTCGDVGLQNALVVPKSLFAMMAERLGSYAVSKTFKQEWLGSWMARRNICQFLADRCSKEFLSQYLAQAPELLEWVSEPEIGRYATPQSDLGVQLHRFGLLPEANRKRLVAAACKATISGNGVVALSNSGIRGLLQPEESAKLDERMRLELLPKLPSLRSERQLSHDPSERADEHMAGMQESFSELKRHFLADVDVVERIDGEAKLANDWVANANSPEPKRGPRALGKVEHAEGKHGARSIFDDLVVREGDGVDGSSH